MNLQFNNKPVKDNWRENKSAGIEWIRSFIQRLNLSLQTPEQTSLSRATIFNRTDVEAFFSNLRQLMERYSFAPQDIYNLNETGLTIIHKSPKIIAAKGQKQVGQVTPAERGTLVTLCGIISATGKALLPFLVFPQVHFKQHMLKGAPVGSAGVANKTGWMTGEHFCDVLKHFDVHERPSIEKPKLILLDNHESHLSIPGLDFAKKHGIVLLTYPPHCSHKLQPLDFTVFGPMKKYFNNACNDWMSSHPAQPITIYDIGDLLAKSFPLAFTSNICRGFQAAGIFPFNSEIFTDDDFLPASVTDRPIFVAESSCEVEVNNASQLPVGDGSFASFQSRSPLIGSPMEASRSSSPVITPNEIRPFPKAGHCKSSIGRKN